MSSYETDFWSAELNTVRAEYDRRLLEVNEYIEYLARLEKTTGISTTLMATMKASTVLMMYNLVESTMTNVVQAFFDNLEQKNIGFSQVNDTVKVLVLKNVKRRNPSTLIKEMRSTSRDIAVASFDRKEVFSGNIDSKKIRDTLKEFGVKTTGRIAEDVLLEIKNARNNLAHGEISFVDSGKNLSAQELHSKSGKLGKVLEQVLKDFESYASTSSYV